MPIGIIFKMTQGKVDGESQAWSEEKLFILWTALWGDI